MKESTGQEPYKSIKEKMVEMIRNYLKKKITGNLGDVCETEDKLICYVRKDEFRTYESYCACIGERSNIYHIDCVDFKEKYKELVEKYNLNKQIVYVLDGLIFSTSQKVEIHGDKNCEIQVSNCRFNDALAIVTSGNCTLSNSLIAPWNFRPLIYIKAENLMISNTNVKSCYARGGFASNYGIDVKLIAKNLIDIEFSNIGVGLEESITYLNIESNLINIVSSTLADDHTSIKGKILQTEESFEKTSDIQLFDMESFGRKPKRLVRFF